MIQMLLEHMVLICQALILLDTGRDLPISAEMKEERHLLSDVQ